MACRDTWIIKSDIRDIWDPESRAPLRIKSLILKNTSALSSRQKSILPYVRITSKIKDLISGEEKRCEKKMVAKVFGKTKLGASITHYAFRQQHHCERHINVKLSKSSLGLWKLEEMRGSKDQLAKKHFMGICLCSLCELRSWDFGVWELLFTRVSLCMQKRKREIQ